MLRSHLLSTAAFAAATDDGLDIPANLRRTETAKASNGVSLATTAKAPASPAEPAKPAKPAKAKTPRKGKVVEAKHKPTKVEATEANPQKSIVPVRFKEKYAAHDDSNGDNVAEALRSYLSHDGEFRNEDGRPAIDLSRLAEVAKANEIDLKAYAGLNPGMQRMNVGNRLRGMVKNKKTVVIGKRKFADPVKALAVKPAEAQAAA